MHELWELKQKQSLPLSEKINASLDLIRDWYEHWGGQVYISFSGGKDSTVLLDLARLNAKRFLLFLKASVSGEFKYLGPLLSNCLPLKPITAPVISIIGNITRFLNSS